LVHVLVGSKILENNAILYCRWSIEKGTIYYLGLRGGLEEWWMKKRVERSRKENKGGTG
jgi:hypothetical protein